MVLVALDLFSYRPGLLVTELTLLIVNRKLCCWLHLSVSAIAEEILLFCKKPVQ